MFENTFFSVGRCSEFLCFYFAIFLNFIIKLMLMSKNMNFFLHCEISYRRIENVYERKNNKSY